MKAEDKFFDFAVDEVSFGVTVVGDLEAKKEQKDELKWSSDFLSKLLAKHSRKLTVKVPKHWLSLFGDLRDECSLVRLRVNMACEAKLAEDMIAFELFPSFVFNGFNFGFVPKCLDPKSKLQPGFPTTRVHITSCKDCKAYGSGTYIFAFKPEDGPSRGFGIAQRERRGWISLYNHEDDAARAKFQERLNEVIKHDISIPIQKVPLKLFGNSIEMMQDFIANGKLTNSIGIKKIAEGISAYMMTSEGALAIVDALQNALSELNAQFMCCYDTPFAQIFYDAMNSFSFCCCCDELKIIGGRDLPNFMKLKHNRIGDSCFVSSQVVGWFPYTKNWKINKHSSDPFSCPVDDNCW